MRGSLCRSEQIFTNFVAVGDQVLVSLNGRDWPMGNAVRRGTVEAVLPRRSALVRPDVFTPHLQQVIVANVDLLLIVLSWREPAWWPELLDRYLIGAERNRLCPVICVNKVDLAHDASEPRAALAPYARLGYPALFTSAATGEGLRELADLLQGRMTALAGLSGVGKSSLLSQVEPGLDLRISEVSGRRHEGRHTTTSVTLHRLRMGGFVVDTPGIREFGLSNLRQAELAACYRSSPQPHSTAASPIVPTGMSRDARCAVPCARGDRPGALRKLPQDPALVAAMSGCARIQSHATLHHTPCPIDQQCTGRPALQGLRPPSH